VLRNRRRTALAVLGISLGVLSLVALRGFLNGQKAVFRTGLTEGQLGAIQVHRRGYLAHADSLPLWLAFRDSSELRRRILAVPGVRALSPRLLFGALLSPPATPPDESPVATPLVLTGLDPALDLQVSPKRAEWLAAGRLPVSFEARELLLNADLARGMGLEPLAEVGPDESTWPALVTQDREGALNGEAVRLTGTLLSALPGDRRVGWLGLQVAQRLLRMEGEVTEYALAVDSLDDAPQVRAALSSALGEQFEVHTWDELLPFMSDLLANTDRSFAVTMAVLWGIVLLGIANAMLMTVLERVREIGTMAAVGMRRVQIVWLFLLEGALLGALGGLAGTVLGWAAVLLAGAVGIPMPIPGATQGVRVRPFIEGSFLAFVLVSSVVIAAVAALRPALSASRLHPVEALRHR
jgi:putative ABC transport system permease protein